MFKLNNLTPAGKKRKRIGRGGSRGGTSGKGHKGQLARSGGKPRPAFEGGQMPLYRRLPKRGFNNARFQKESRIISLGTLSLLFDDGDQVTKAVLQEKGYLKGKESFLLKILGSGEFTKKLIVEADAFSKSAIKALEDRGGEARLTKEK